MTTIKVKLLTDGGFKGLETLDFSTVFPAVSCHDISGVDISLQHLISAGAHVDIAQLNGHDAHNGTLYFLGVTPLHPAEYEEVKEVDITKTFGSIRLVDLRDYGHAVQAARGAIVPCIIETFPEGRKLYHVKAAELIALGCDISSSTLAYPFYSTEVEEVI